MDGYDDGERLRFEQRAVYVKDDGDGVSKLNGLLGEGWRILFSDPVGLLRLYVLGRGFPPYSYQNLFDDIDDDLDDDDLDDLDDDE